MKPTPLRLNRARLLVTAASQALVPTTGTCRNTLRTSLAGAIMLSSSSLALENMWEGTVDNDYNNPANWSEGRVPAIENGQTEGDNFDDAVINTLTNFPVLAAEPVATPRDYIIGQGATTNGRLDQRAGTTSTGASNWMYVGNSDGTGVFNLADTSVVDADPQNVTGFGQGSGTINIGNRLYVGGNNNGAASDGLVNVNTSGALNAGGDISVGTGGTGVLNIHQGAVVSGTVPSTAWSFIGRGEGGDGTLNMSGGSFTQYGRLYVGDGGASTGEVNLTGGTIQTALSTQEGYTGGYDVRIGVDANGTVNQSAGALSAAGELWIGQGGTGNGTYNLSGGDVAVDNWIAVGREGATGSLNMTGGTLTKTGNGSVAVGTGPTGNGTVNVSGGLFDIQSGDLLIGENNTATGQLNLSDSGEINVAQLQVGVGETTTGTANLNGGILRTSQISGGAGTSAGIFNGTQIIATADNAAFISNLDVATIGDDGLLIDSGAFNVATDQDFAGTGDIIKTGSGSLALNGSITHIGGTTVSAGTLFVNGSLGSTSGVTVESAATLAGSGGSIAGSSLIEAAATLSPGLNPNEAGALTFDNLTLDEGGVFIADLTANGVNDSLTGTLLNLNGEIAVVLNYSPVAGDTFDLLDGTITGSPTLDLSQANLGEGLFWDASSFEVDGTLAVIPEPTVPLLSVLGLGALMIRRRRSAAV